MCASSQGSCETGRVEAFILASSSCVPAAKALVRLDGCKPSSWPLLHVCQHSRLWQDWTGMSLHLGLFFMCASSQGSCETGRVEAFILASSLCMPAVKALARLDGCKPSSWPLLHVCQHSRLWQDWTGMSLHLGLFMCASTQGSCETGFILASSSCVPAAKALA